MSVTGERLARAEARSKEAKTRLAGTLAEIRYRLRPSTLVRNAAEQLRETGGNLAQSSVDTARNNPAAVAGALTLLGLLLSRHPLSRLFRRRKRRDATADAATSLKEKRAKAPRTRRSK